MNNTNIEVFLEELSKLTTRLGIKIVGCTCCDTPWLRTTYGQGTYILDDGILRYMTDYEENDSEIISGVYI